MSPASASPESATAPAGPVLPALGVGDTPLVELRRIFPSERVLLCAKAEWMNPGGSVKDRAACSILREGLRSGSFTQGRVLLDATSGNTGIAYAWMAARLGIPVKLCVPASINPQRRRLLEAYGAELVLTDPLEGSDGAIRAARRLNAEDPAAYWYPDQYSNPANWKAHYEGTGPEIWRQAATLGRPLTHFVAGLGTSGTFVGVSRRLRELDPYVTLVSVQPDSPLHGLEGLKHMATALVPAIYDPFLADREEFIPTEEAQATARRLALEEGLLAGPSGGANVAAALRLARGLEEERRNALIVTVIPDGGERYLNEPFWRTP